MSFSFVRILRLVGRGVLEWVAFSVVSFAVYWMLWFIIDPQAFADEGYGWSVVLFDFSYCAVFSMVAMLVSRQVFRLTRRMGPTRWMYILSSLLTLFLNVLTAVVFETVTDEVIYGDVFMGDITEGVYIYSLVATVLSCILLGIRHYELFRTQYEARQAAEMELMKNQIEPHFVFNSLATLDGLIEIDREAAHQYLDGLSRLYRHVLQHVDDHSVPIYEALAVIRSYAQLLAVRYPGHIQLSIDAELDHQTGYVLPMALQQLVENAVKHNMHSPSAPIRIRLYVEAGSIVCANTYRPNNVPIRSHKTGLTNLRARYRFYTGRDCEVRQADGTFEVHIPIIPQKI